MDFKFWCFKDYLYIGMVEDTSQLFTEVRNIRDRN